MARRSIHPLKAWRLSQNYTDGRGSFRVLTISEAARRVSVAVSLWQDWEEGRKIPTQANMVAVCDLTGLMPNDFYFKNGVPYRIARNLEAERRAAG
ncbi:hypothetical protein AI27_05630 [Sphingomonas sp. BHC-A]|nr:hypothetical protein AI27_05630 [Sphingomonas sp. BHC-A]